MTKEFKSTNELIEILTSKGVSIKDDKLFIEEAEKYYESILKSEKIPNLFTFYFYMVRFCDFTRKNARLVLFFQYLY